MIRFVLLASSAAFVLAAGPANTTQVLMREKLEATHGLLEGLVKEDFAKIETHAQKLANISHATEWHKLDDADFLHYAKSFQNSADFLVQEAKKKSVEGVSMGYVRVTLDCMQCHNFVRAGRKK